MREVNHTVRSHVGDCGEGIFVWSLLWVVFEIIVCCNFVVLAFLLAFAQLSWHRGNLDYYYYYYRCGVKSCEHYEGT